MHGKLEYYLLVCELLVDGGESVQLGLYVHLVLGVQKDLEGLAAVNFASCALADDLGGVDEILWARCKAGAGPEEERP